MSFIMNSHNPVHVVAAIFKIDGKVLACRRASLRSFAGQWEFPGGKAELGENAFTALEREIKEEMGFDCRALETYDVSVTKVGKLLIKLETIMCSMDPGQTLSSTDHDEFRWLGVDELHKVKWAKPDRPAVKKLSMVIY